MLNWKEIKIILGIGLVVNFSFIIIVRCFLDKIGYSLECLWIEIYKKKWLWIYWIVNFDDGRFEVF